MKALLASSRVLMRIFCVGFGDAGGGVLGITCRGAGLD
jgi:hypothetical protein